MKLIYDFTLEKLQEYFLEKNQKPFRAKQLFNWLYTKKADSFEDMTVIGKEMRQDLAEEFVIDGMKIADKQVAKDGTVKYLMELMDGNLIETVLMIHDYGMSLCVTSQVGCNMGCKFCASGLLKKVRNLTAGEMVGQIMKVQNDLDVRVSHVVVMGTGEPFDNYDNVMDFVRIINHPNGLAIGARHITISTCGIIPAIEKYADEGIQTNLAISLHASNDEVRDKIMPINKTYNMDALREAVANYITKTNRRVTFEYILLKDINDDITHARQLSHYLRGLNAYVNLIPYNSVDENGFEPSPSDKIATFKSELMRLHINTTLRREFGSDIDGACGQLRAKKKGVL